MKIDESRGPPVIQQLDILLRSSTNDQDDDDDDVLRPPKYLLFGALGSTE